MNNYCSVADFNTDASVSSVNDATRLRIIESVSRAFDSPKILNRQVFDETGTWYFDSCDGDELLLPFDLESVTTLKFDEDGDGTFELTLTTSDYWLQPYNRANKRIIKLNPLGQRGSFPGRPRSVQVVGVRGYRNTSEAVGSVVANNPLASGDTSLQVAASSLFSAGTIYILESEEVYASAIPDATHVTIQRGVNGTTAVAHNQNVVIYRRRYPADIELACKLQVSRVFQELRTGQSAANADSSAGGFTWSSLYPIVRDLLTAHRWVSFH